MPDAQTAILTIDLAAIAANYRYLVQQVEPVACAGVVKADAYGLGAAMVAPVLQREGCRHFFVATVDEGLALRQILPHALIYVLNGLPPGSAATLASADLIPVLASFEQIEDWRKFCTTAAQPKPAALQIDTGISRLGLPQADVVRLATDPRLLRGFPVVHVMSHLACGDEPAHPMNDRQLMLFKTLIERFPWPGTRPTFGMAASSGIFLGTDFHFDLVRPGAALYGLEPTVGRPNPLRPVVRLQGKILQIRDVDLGMTVGYGASHRFEGPSRLATIGVGYADGIFRSLGNRGAVFVAGERAPVVGRISMDLMTVDVGRVPPAALHPGAAVDIIGPEQSVDDLARSAGTIGYEVLTAFGRRYQRRYLSDTRRAG
ncbi:MAG TPA: alanine racemase [Dongiaceae bacterium]|jgi:alanine racemase|nr:alanine racemase [Dongiaceae bacterium]